MPFNEKMSTLMKTLLYLSLLTAMMLSLISCKKDQDKELEKLNEMYAEIKSLAESTACTNADNWSFTAFGAKACGGPIGYIAYSDEIDVAYFLQLVANHAQKQDAYNLKWGINSDCSVPEEPTGVVCENNLPVFVY
jgi:hypothetical protein